MFISLTATHLVVVLAKLAMTLSSSLVRIASYVAIIRVVARWYVAFAHVTNATVGRDLIPPRPWASHRRGIAAYDEGAE